MSKQLPPKGSSDSTAEMLTNEKKCYKLDKWELVLTRKCLVYFVSVICACNTFFCLVIWLGLVSTSGDLSLLINQLQLCQCIAEGSIIELRSHVTHIHTFMPAVPYWKDERHWKQSLIFHSYCHGMKLHRLLGAKFILTLSLFNLLFFLTVTLL